MAWWRRRRTETASNVESSEDFSRWKRDHPTPTPDNSRMGFELLDEVPTTPDVLERRDGFEDRDLLSD
jgi:hypothetical protein